MWGWSWPLNSVTITSTYGERGQSFHEGVDLKAGVGTPVFAAHSGIVRYAGSKISGYGKLVVIRDEGSGLSTIYAHNSKLFVKTGQRVKQGRKISLSGKTGHATGPHLHFEVRQGTLALDPLKILAPPGSKRTLASRK
jgi:murein DD-endopeptidase MepM/ murein hydrolase activator NlpD